MCTALYECGRQSYPAAILFKGPETSKAFATFIIVDMDFEEPKPRRRVGIWIFVGLAILVAVGGILITREPATPFAFLNKYPVVETRQSKDGKLRIVVFKGNLETIWQEIRNEFSGQRTFVSSGYMNVNGVSAEYKSIGTENGLIKASDDLAFANDGFGTYIVAPEKKDGYCAVAFTRPKTIFDRAMEWMRGFFNPSKSKEEAASPPPETIRV